MVLTLIKQIAAKLLAEGMKPEEFTKQKAKELTANVVGKKAVHGCIDKYPALIQMAMMG